MGEPLAYCDDFSEPHYLDSPSNKWLPCTSASHGTDCKCGSDHSIDAIPIPSAPECGSTAKPEYQTTCDAGSKIKGPCWFCKAVGSSIESWYPADCFEVAPSDPRSRNCQLEQLVPFMADDGDGGDITIPSFIVSDYYGQLLKHGIKKRKSDGKRPLQVIMSWSIEQRKRANYELWSSCEDSNGAEFKRDFQETALKLIEVADFTPRYYIYDGHALQCDSTYECGTQCISDGRYCGPDPDDDLDKGVSGKDIVTENLRQMCIWKTLQEGVDNGKDRKDLMKWWCYVNDFANTCFNGEGVMVSLDFGGEKPKFLLILLFFFYFASF